MYYDLIRQIKLTRYSITMIEHINNYNVNTISHEKCLPVSICKTKTHTITKKTLHVYCNSQ